MDLLEARALAAAIDGTSGKPVRLLQGKTTAVSASSRTCTVLVEGVSMAGVDVMDHISMAVDLSVWIMAWGKGRWLVIGSTVSAILVGEVAYAQKTAQELNFTTVADITSLTVTYAQTIGVRYKTTAKVRTAQSGTGGTQSLLLTDAANTQLNADVADVVANATSTRSLILREVSVATGNVTRKLRLAVSAGDVDVIVAGTQPGFILVEAMGYGA